MGVITYRKGMPTASCLYRLIHEFTPKYHYMFNLQSLTITGEINWQRPYLNDLITDLIDFLNSKGIKCELVRLYDSPSTGSIRFIKKEK